jgi:hypothetical protein
MFSGYDVLTMQIYYIHLTIGSVWIGLVSLSTDISTSETAWESLWHVQKLFLAYFHKLSGQFLKTSYSLYKTVRHHFIFYYKNIL